MKKILAVILVMQIYAAFSQVPSKDKPPTQKEMDEMMKEMQQSLDGMSPEDKKMMEDMGLSIPSLKNTPKISEIQALNATNKPAKLIPDKDMARISSISKTPLTTTTLPAYLQTIHEQIIKKLSPEIKKDGELVYNTIKSKYQTSIAVGNAAVGSWLFGKPGIALYVMDRACNDDPLDDDNLNNFAALLTMSGAEQLALPLLTRLNSQYPKNSTILNNIAQAWFGLGDIEKAVRYTDSTLTLCPAHPEANMIKARIAESKGNKNEAIAAIKKSIETTYSAEKEIELENLGHELKSEDLKWDRPLIYDGLGLVGFKWPAYPKNVEESKVLKPQWEDFRDKCNTKIIELKAEQAILEQKWIEQQQKRNMEVLQAGQTGKMATLFPDFAPKAFIKLAPLVKGIEGVNNFVFANEYELVTAAIKKVEDYEDKEVAAMMVVNEKYKNSFGEGQDNPFEAHCKDVNAYRSAFLNEANTTTEQRNRVYLNYTSQQINNILYYRLHTQWPDEFALSKVIAEISWLTLISGQNVQFREESASCRYKDKPDTSRGGKLREFDDIKCEYKSELNLLFGTIETNCSVMTAKLDLSFIKLAIKTKQGDKDNETFYDQFQTGYVEIGIKRGVSYGKGPMKVEAKAGISGFLEVGKTGIMDAGFKIGADVKAGTNFIKKQNGTEVGTITDAAGVVHKLDSSMGPFKDLSVSIIGTEAKISINSGISVTGKGILSGL